jgi:predicted MFS family arabinose efflux permease
VHRIHYAWIILGLIFLALVTGAGVRLAFGSFVHPWEHDFGISRGMTSMIATLSFIVYGLLQPFAGRWADRRGPGGVLTASLALVAAGLLLSRTASSIWLVGLGFGIVASAGFAGASTVTASVAVARWFHDRRGLAMALLTVATSLGQMILTPAAIFLNESLGWRQTFLIYATAVAVVAPFVWWLVKPDPAAVGLLPYGAAEAPPAPAEGKGKGDGKIGLPALLRTPNFWWLMIPFFICGITTTGMIDTHLVPFAEDHHLPQGATALAVALLAGFNSLGILIAGYLTDRFSRRRLLAFLYAARGLTLLFLIFVRSPEALIAFGILFGLVDFSTVPPTVSLSAEVRGSGNVGLVFGMIALSHQIGSALGAFVPGLLHDLTGSYELSFLLGAATLAVATLFSLWIKEEKRAPAGPAPVRS